jgi:FtsZ-interacting cell division protein ZipA
MKTGNILPLVGSLALIGLLVFGATWYRRRRQSPQKALQEKERQNERDQD